MEHIKRIKRELAYKGSILEFYKDTMVTPDGKVTYWDHIEHKGAAAVVPVLDDGRIVLVRQYRNSPDEETLEIPAGGLEADEPTELAAIRELEEETGYKAEADKVEPLEELIDTLAVELKARHIRRLREGKCTIELGFAHSDILNNLERVADHCSNIAVDVIQSDQLEFDAHEYLDRIKNKDNQQFARDYKTYKEKYRLPETRSFK